MFRRSLSDQWSATRAGSLFLVAALVGCGGSGGATPVAVPLSPNVRMLQKGDAATYTFSGTFTATGKPSATVTGSTVHTISDKVGDVLTVVHDLHIIINGAPFDLHQVGTERQNPNGSIEAVGDNAGVNGAARTVTSNTFVQPGTFTVPLNISGTTMFSDGSSSQSAMNVTGTGTATTLLGTFGVYVVKGKVQSSYGNSTTTTDLFCPPLGIFITRTEIGSGPTGVITINYSIASYHLT